MGYLWQNLATFGYLWLSLAICQSSIRVQGEAGESNLLLFETFSFYCQAKPKPQPANPHLGAEIALHPTPYTLKSSYAGLKPNYHNCGDLFMTR